jgi:hypothetical protein
MPIYSGKLLNQMIGPSWRLIVLELSLYTEKIIFNRSIKYEEEEEYKMEDERHDYQRNYESDDEDEKYGLEGLVLEIIDFAIDLLKRRVVMNELRPALLTFLLCIKGYCLLPHNSILLWMNDPNLYITEEYDDENINTIRSKSLSMIREITKEMEDDALLHFLKIIISEFTEGLKLENYSEVLKLDDYNFLGPYFEQMNSNTEYIFRRHEANLLILGNLADDLYLLYEKNRISKGEIKELLDFLFTIISSPSKENGILTGRAIWTASRLISILRNDVDFLKEIFMGVSIALTHQQSDLSICLVASQCLTSICQKLESNLKNQETGETKFESEYINKDLRKLIELIKETNEETILIPIDSILALSKLNKEEALFVPINNSKLIVETYSKYYNHPYIGAKLLELIKSWCTDNRSAKVLIGLFAPFAMFVFDDFFKSLGKTDAAFEDIKRTVMTTVGNEVNFKTDMDMLPVNKN